jgi:hypothetical protein
MIYNKKSKDVLHNIINAVLQGCIKMIRLRVNISMRFRLLLEYTERQNVVPVLKCHRKASK